MIKPIAANQLLSYPKNETANASKSERLRIETTGKAILTQAEQERYNLFWVVSGMLNRVVGWSVFDVDHAESIFSYGIAAIHPDNLQILENGLNRSKNWRSHRRFTMIEQVDHIRMTVARRSDPLTSAERQSLELALNMLNLIWNTKAVV